MSVVSASLSLQLFLRMIMASRMEEISVELRHLRLQQRQIKNVVDRMKSSDSNSLKNEMVSQLLLIDERLVEIRQELAKIHQLEMILRNSGKVWN